MEDWKFLSACHSLSEDLKTTCWRASDGTIISNEEYDEWLKHRRIPNDTELETSRSGIINIESNLPHTISEVICIDCGKRWIAARPSEVRLAKIQCPHCTAIGFVIETGQRLEDTKYEA